MVNLLKPTEVDELFRYGAGRSKRLAMQGLIPHIVLPNGDIRFTLSDIEKLIQEGRRVSNDHRTT